MSWACRGQALYLFMLAEIMSLSWLREKKRAYQLGRSRVTIKTVFYCCPEQFPCLELRICNMSSSVNVMKPKKATEHAAHANVYFKGWPSCMLINYNSHFPHWTKAPHVKDTAPGNFFDNISALCSYWKMNRFSSLFGRMRSVIVGMVHIRALPGILQWNFPKCSKIA